MALLEIVLYPDPRLRQPCTPAKKIDDRIRKLFDDMAETMYAAPGIGLAASQVGIQERLIVIDLGEDEETNTPSKLYKIANPEIVEAGGKIEYEEGCLSIPGLKEIVKRPGEVVVQGLNERGEEIEIVADGLLAVCLQHEIDHLDGILFIDHLSRVKQERIKSRLAKRSRPDDE